MRRLLLAASLTLAVCVLPATTVAAPRHSGYRLAGCHRLWYMWGSIRYARQIYRGTRVPGKHQLYRVWHQDHCQHNPHAHRYLRKVIKRQRRRNAHRRYVAAHPPYDYGTASWYYDSGQTASGWHAAYGFATCGSGGGPCYSFGTRVRFCYHGRCVVATADDHGPYVAGRDFDLGASTAQALGFGGVDTVAYRVL